MVSSSQINNSFGTAVECRSTLSPVELNPDDPLYDIDKIHCIENIFATCQPGRIGLPYYLGSIGISIAGEDQDRCIVEIEHAIEMGFNRFTCSVPLEEMAKWNSWKEPAGDQAVSDIATFCTKIGFPSCIFMRSCRAEGFLLEATILIALPLLVSIAVAFVLFTRRGRQ